MEKNSAALLFHWKSSLSKAKRDCFIKRSHCMFNNFKIHNCWSMIDRYAVITVDSNYHCSWTFTREIMFDSLTATYLTWLCICILCILLFCCTYSQMTLLCSSVYKLYRVITIKTHLTFFTMFLDSEWLTFTILFGLWMICIKTHLSVCMQKCSVGCILSSFIKYLKLVSPGCTVDIKSLHKSSGKKMQFFFI